MTGPLRPRVRDESVYFTPVRRTVKVAVAAAIGALLLGVPVGVGARAYLVDRAKAPGDALLEASFPETSELTVSRRTGSTKVTFEALHFAPYQKIWTTYDTPVGDIEADLELYRTEEQAIEDFVGFNMGETPRDPVDTEIADEVFLLDGGPGLHVVARWESTVIWVHMFMLKRAQWLDDDAEKATLVELSGLLQEHIASVLDDVQ